jgi:cysteine-rich repeat protein
VGLNSAAAADECDDGNLVNGDGCSDACVVEAGFHCTLVGFGTICYTFCGDGVISPGETCDDGNPFEGDGCDQLCQIEGAWTCPTAAVVAAAPIVNPLLVNIG